MPLCLMAGGKAAEQAIAALRKGCASPKPHLIGKQLILQINDCRLVFAMLNAIVVSIRFILLILAGQKQVALENAALRQQLAVFKRNVPRPQK